jgi:hypothetical protein
LRQPNRKPDEPQGAGYGDAFPVKQHWNSDEYEQGPVS